MKKVCWLVLVALFAWCGMAQKIGLLLGKSGHNTEFDAAFKTLNWEVTRFECTTEGMASFTSMIEQFDLVISVPLFNYSRNGGWLLPKDATDTKAIQSYLKKGGMLVITDGSYRQVRQWLSAIDPRFDGLKTGKCTSSQWAVLGHTTNEEPIHPLRSFPHRITESDSWPHFEPLPSDSTWQVLARCSEGMPVVLCQPYGKGMVVLSALRQPSEKILENYYTYGLLQKSGLNIKEFVLPPLKPGKGQFRMTVEEQPTDETTISYEILDSKNRMTTFTSNIVDKSCMIHYQIQSRGDITATLYVNTPAGRKRLFRKQETIPRLLEVTPNAYRGILSTKRRTNEVDFHLAFTPDKEDLAGARLTIRIFDAVSNQVAQTETELPKTKIPAELWVPVPLPRTLGACGYRIDVVMRQAIGKKPFWASASAPFEILRPRVGQVVVDEDNTFLLNGRPFFPIGIYHANPKDYAEIAELGFNLVQFWKWDLGDDGFGAPIGLYRATANKLHCLFESNHYGEEIWRQCAETYGTHPAIFMWYVADEPSEGNEAGMRLTRDTWHRYDKHHPTYLLSCREDLFEIHHTFADVFAFDPYGGGKKDPFDAVKQAIDWLDTATEVTGARKPLVVVPWSCSSDPRSLRVMAYVALTHNARGIIWYPWKQAGGGPLGIGLCNDKESQAMHKTLNAEITTMMPGLLSPKRRPFVQETIHGIVCGDTPKRRFLILVNVSGESRAVQMKLPEWEKVKKATLPFAKKIERLNAKGEKVVDKKGVVQLDEQPIEIVGGTLQTEFQPYETKVYRW